MTTICHTCIATCLIAAWCSLCPAAAAAQATGAITGLVVDGSGGAVPGATIEATNQDTAQARTTVTAENGFYTIPLLSPGTYRVAASLAGFRTTIREDVEVVVNETVRADLDLELGAVSEQVLVSGATPLVETRNATLGIVVDERSIVDLPLNGRNFTQLGTLMPGVVAPPVSLGGQGGNATPGGLLNATGGFHVNGMRNQSNNFLLDGAPNNDSFNSGFVLRPPPDAIQEFKILTHSYAPEYGRNAGSIVNVVTRSGTNVWHGSAWEFNRDDALQARNFFARSKPTLKQNQFGGAAGGPLARNRLFVFGYFEGFHNTEGQTDTRPVLSAAQRAGDFSGGAVIRDPVTGRPFDGNVIPADRIDPIVRKIVDTFIPLPNSPGQFYGRSPNVDDTRRQFGVRGDYKAGTDHNVFSRYITGHTRSVNLLGMSNFAPSANTSVATLQDFTASDTWLLSNNTINVARVSVNRIDARPTVSSGLNPQSLGFAYSGSHTPALGLPFIMVQGFFTTGDLQGQFDSRVNNVFGVADDVTFVTGRHSLKFGGELRRDAIGASYIFDPNGDYLFTGLYSGNAAADFLLGYPVLFRRATGDPNLDAVSWVSAGYAQDEYRPGSRLTVNYGVRYEVNGPFTDVRDRLNAFRPGQQSRMFPDAPIGLVYPGDDDVPRGTYATDVNNLAPRVAAIWDPRGDGRTSLRAAWGIFYDTVPAQGDFFQSAVVAPPFQSLAEINFPLQMTSSPFADPLEGRPEAARFPQGLIYVGSAPEYESPVVQHFNVSVQHQLGDHWGVEAGYVGSRGRNLPLYIEINPTIPVLTPAPAVGPRVFPAFSLMKPTFSVGRSWYDSLQTSARLRPWHGFNMLAAYTLSHSVDHASGLNLGETRPILPVTIGESATIEASLAREKGNSLFDVRQRLVLSFGYELPRLDDRAHATRLLFGGWQVNGIVQAQTGFPLTVVEPSNISLTSATNRPNLTCNPNERGARTVAQWFDTRCFQRLTLAGHAGQIGNEGRGVVRGPGFSRVDVALVKNIVLTGNHQLQWRMEAFNALNSPRFNQPGNQIGSPTFGQITSADDGRIVQLGIKYAF